MKQALITGGARGIGLGIAEAMLAAGYRVTVTGLTAEEVAGAPRREHLDAVELDVTSDSDVATCIGKLKSLDALVNCAGIILRDGQEFTVEGFQKVIDVNLTGTFRTVRRAVQSMMREKYGRIVLVGSVVGLLGNPGQVNYSASKSALVGMARSITREVGSRGITANVIAPGFIETAMTAELGEDLVKQYQANIPARRFGSTDEVANAAVFLGSDAAGYISGAVLPVDGGLGMGH